MIDRCQRCGHLRRHSHVVERDGVKWVVRDEIEVHDLNSGVLVKGRVLVCYEFTPTYIHCHATIDP